MQKRKKKSIVEHKTDSRVQAITWNKHLSISEYKFRRMTFGKYTNWMIKDLPLDYLKWGILNLEETIAEYFAREYKTRKL